MSFWENPHNIQLDWPKFGILWSPRHIMDKINKWHLHTTSNEATRVFKFHSGDQKGHFINCQWDNSTMLHYESFVHFSWKQIWMKLIHAPSERVWTHFSGCLPWRKNTEKEETGDLAHDNDNMYNFKLFINLARPDCIDILMD